jgi:hypothetical protein
MWAEMNLIIAVVLYPCSVHPDLNLESLFLLESYIMQGFKSPDLRHWCPMHGSSIHFNSVPKMVIEIPKVEHEHKHLPPLCAAFRKHY